LGFIQVCFKNKDTLVGSQLIPPHGLRIAPTYIG
jgi:hypothetical protein